MEVSGGIVTGLPGRYATALFDLARGGRQIDVVSASLDRLRTALNESDELRTLTSSPLLDREQATRGVLAVARALELDPLTTNFLGVLGRNRRLSALPGIISAFRKLAAHHRGEITADVTTAHPLYPGQIDALKLKLRAALGRNVEMDLHVDPSILGGIVVRVGSRLVDSSIKTKLAMLGQAMKG